MATDLFSASSVDSITREDIHDLLLGVRDEIRSQVQALEFRVKSQMESLIRQAVQHEVSNLDLRPLIKEAVGEYEFESMIAELVTDGVAEAVGDIEILVSQAMSDSYEKAMCQLSQIILAIPQPIVNVPDGPTPQVTVVNEAPVINVPELAPPVVNIPETLPMPAPVVNVSVPHRKVTKNISYDEYGRPSRVVEVEVEGEGDG